MDFKLVGIPIYTLTKYVGMAQGVGVLRSHGLQRALESKHTRVEDLGNVPIVKIHEDTGPSNLRNLEKFTQMSEHVSKMVSGIEDEEKRFLFLGGECSLIVGATAGLQKVRRRKIGVLWLDSHGDFNTPETTPSGFIGGMCLTMACGLGPKLSPLLEAQRPSIRVSNVAHAASRNLDPPERAAMIGSEMALVEMKELRRKGVMETMRRLFAGLEDSSDEIILHVDIDCTDPTEIPAVSFPEPAGLSLLELREILRLCGGSERLKAVDLTAYNAGKDRDGVSAGRIIDTFSKGLGEGS